MVHYPINNYDVSLNIGNYVHFARPARRPDARLLRAPEDLDKAKKQFAQAKEMLDAYRALLRRVSLSERWLQADRGALRRHGAPDAPSPTATTSTTAICGRDWTGVGISPRFDFIIIHESGHEWFGNAVTAADRSDMWIHEGWTTYLEASTWSTAGARPTH